ncbi:MAG TPA: 30S ribosomal protein S9, partial [Candidatus Saccharimonadales bacterium]|nr:30S ribosomal protein S9 [Candidatus Saccharimonadales bacterium]
MVKSNYFYGVGRRKSATARARLTGGKGVITINGQAAEAYLDGNQTLLAELTDPLALIGKQKELDVSLVIS